MDQVSNNNVHSDPQLAEEVQGQKFATRDAGHFNRLCVEYFEKYACTQFAPLGQFLNLQHCAQVVHSQPSFQPTISKSLRDNLKVERQIKYLKASLHQPHIYSTIQQQLSSEIKYEPMKRRGNLLLNYKNKLYFCFETKLKCLQVDKVVKCQKLGEKEQNKAQNVIKRDSWQVNMQQPKELANLEEHIYQLKRAKNLLLMRTSRKLFFYDCNEQKIVDCHSFKHEILTFWTDQLQEQLVYLSLIDGNQTVIQLLNIRNNKQVVQSFVTTSQIHTAWNVHKNWVVACGYNQVLTLDFRLKNSQQLRKQKENQRIFGGTSLKSNIFSENYFMTSESFDAKIYDLRKGEKILSKINHYCEEAPPTILSLYDIVNETQKNGKKSKQSLLSRLQASQQNKNALVIGVNPYVFGSCLMTEISPELSFQRLSERSKQVNSFQLLFDKGKLQRGYYPLSTNLVHIQNQLSLFHLDNLGGISVQLFHREKTLQKNNKEKESKLRRFQFSKECGFQEMKHPNQDWLIKHRLGVYLKQEKQSFWENEICQDSMSLELIEDTLKTKYLRYSDLKKFYSQLSLEKQENLTKALDEEQKELQIFKASKEKDPQHTLSTWQSSYAETKENNINRSLFSSTLLQQMSKEWQQSFSKM